MMGESTVLETFSRNSTKADVAVVEGVMGLFDGAVVGAIAGSTADVAKLAGIPVLLVVNACGIAETIAPIVCGFTDYAEGVKIFGVIANKVGSEKHAAILADALRLAGLPPLLGFLPRDSALAIPERHLGLVSATEKVGGECSMMNVQSSILNKEGEKRAFEENPEFYDALAALAEKHFKLDEIISLTSLSVEQRGVLEVVDSGENVFMAKREPLIRVGVAMDEAFHFYYEDNFDIMRSKGMEIVEFSPLHDRSLPEKLDWLYIGGGFPESFAMELTENRSMMSDVAQFADSGRFIFAECGGLMYLSDGITDFDGNRLEMCGIIKGWTTMEKKLRRLGYREVRMTAPSPMGAVGTTFRGHEFHWSSINECDNAEAFCEIRGSKGGEWKSAGFRVGNTFASYIHAHFASNPQMIAGADFSVL
jgi:cobyrinic acid a,c-diamide synthase